MRPRDFLILMLVCLAWGYSVVLSRTVIGDWGVPPLYFAAIRFAIVVVATLPWLLPMPRPRGRIALIGLLMGGGSFGLLFVGLRTVTPSTAAIVTQIGVPFTTLLSIMLLGERIRIRRAIGIALTLAGVVLVMWKPGGVQVSTGLWFIVGSAFAASLGAVMMKQVENVAPLRFQAWVGLVSFVPLTLASLLTEEGQWAASVAAGWPFVAALLFAALIVSVIGHTAYYALIQHYEANLLAPLTLMTPLAAIGFGVAITGDRLDARMIAGAALALLGVLVVALRVRPRSGNAAALLAEREHA
jgi:O-acetylserine/cysteine efflux transporter